MPWCFRCQSGCWKELAEKKTNVGCGATNLVGIPPMVGAVYSSNLTWFCRQETAAKLWLFCLAPSIAWVRLEVPFHWLLVFPYLIEGCWKHLKHDGIPRFLNHFIEAFWGRLKPKMATGNKNWLFFVYELFLSPPIFAFSRFSRSFVGCYRVCGMTVLPDAAHPLKRNKNIQSLEVEGWVTKTTQVYTSLPQKQVAKIETSFTFFRSAWDQLTFGILSSCCLRSGGIGKAITAQNWMAKSVPKTFRRPQQAKTVEGAINIFQVLSTKLKSISQLGQL